MGTYVSSCSQLAAGNNEYDQFEEDTRVCEASSRFSIIFERVVQDCQEVQMEEPRRRATDLPAG